MPRKPPARVEVTKDWDAVMADSVAFAREFLRRADGSPFEPHEAQVQIMRGIQRRTVIDTGRQFGKTEMMAALAIWAAVTHPGWEIAIIAPSLEQARIMFNIIHAYLLKAPVSYFVAGKIKEYPFPLAKFKNGSSITARGANSPQFIRGNRWHVVITDEAAFIKDDTIRTAIEPTMTVTGKVPGAFMVMVSTPFGAGPFKEWYDESQRDEHDPRLVGYHFTSFDNPHADREYLESVRARYGEQSLVWQTEYLGNFPDDDLAVFATRDLLWATQHWPVDPQTGIAQPFPVAYLDGHKYGQGVDLANLRDYFVASVGDLTDLSRVPLVRMDRYQKRGYTAVKGSIRGNYHAYGKARTLIDATTLAESVVEDLADIHAEGYKFSGSSAKYEVVQELVRMFNEHRLLLPPDEREIVSELRAFQYEITPAKKLRMEATGSGHDDIVMSLALLAHLALAPRSVGLFVPASTVAPRTPASALSWADAFNEGL